ncbi:exonuclease subunit SbcD [Duganella sp. BJB488]|uniref:exonuclease SbcCD subunit D C-terminal domain-containing protein n=1 Tax=unclassified Duganella TaxID=2636909 RepID=UPI000E34D3F1|nr:MULTISPECIES: exonuclease SbcCD subunit D C-terminal domain-containing protein [unclassified Duganella]RFP20185.1 exonuclease subunit SbcD [Duganella sp. BJB489]RFP21367.1 exonuclease subunit SbcD [Duganella sp. BJB488]RFP33508.1 exonuclease subunit SbcD [Duganella sp. BJB480]
MRLLHTSDWHLGQSLHNFERTYEHQCFLDWLLDTIAAEQADALLIAGDIFDNANPSSASQKQLYRFLQQAKERAPQLNLVIIAGNHDSPGRLEAPGPLLEAHGTRVVGTVQRKADGEIDLEPLVLPLTGRGGAVEAWCLAVPFLRPGDVPRLPAEDGADPAPDPYLAGIALLYQQTLELALSKRQAGQAILAMGHCHMVDGQMSNDSERRIVIGGTEMLPAGIFGPDIAYAALGHLHLAQNVGKQQHIRYCGSPIPLSFAEVGYSHQILRIDIDGANVREITPLMVPRAVALLRVPAKPAPLAQVLEELAALDLPQAEPERQPFLEVRVLLDAPEPGLRARVEAALDGKPVRLAKIETSSAARGISIDDEVMTLDRLEQLKPDDIFRQLYRQRFDNDAPPDQLSAFTELMLTSRQP